MRHDAGIEHLAAIGRSPRAAGSYGEGVAREYAMRVLRSEGFDVEIEPFDYSALPGRFGTPLGSALTLATVLTSEWLAVHQRAPRAAAAAFAVGIVLLAVFARSMLGRGVLRMRWLRASAENVVARRGRAGREPRVWLVAHLDSKSQPVSSAFRVIGIALLATGVAVALAALGLTLSGVPARTLWWIGTIAATIGAIPPLVSVVGNDSDGAVDNASGVAAVLLAASLLPRDCEVGVLLPSAEELGLAGARAFVANRKGMSGIALNCDTVDDHGELTIMYRGRVPDSLVAKLKAASVRAPRVRRMPIGLLTDSVAFTDAGWLALTVSRGSLATLRRVHSRRDSLAALQGDGIDEVATVLAHAAEALAR
jgi:hypothetical protein